MHLVDRFKTSIKDQLFQFNGHLYEQTDGVAMGSQLGPLPANVLMGSNEKTVIHEDKKYADDTYTIMPDMERKSNDLLPFLGRM